MTESWIRIEDWLAANAPATFDALEPPAEHAQITAAEQAIGLSFPEALKESLLRHNGMNDLHPLLPPLWTPLSAHGIAETWAIKVEIDEAAEPWPVEADEDPEARDGPWWHRQWIPFATSGGGGHLVIDQRPTSLRGRIGDACHESHCTFDEHPMWSSLPAVFDMTATALETGELLDEWGLFVTDEGELDWDL